MSPTARRVLRRSALVLVLAVGALLVVGGVAITAVSFLAMGDSSASTEALLFGVAWIGAGVTLAVVAFRRGRRPRLATR